jgi:voltage-gated potassium channel
VMVISSLVAYHAEHPTNHEFATVGDAMWWGIVTLTTVGYGDIVPTTTTGRWAGVTIMITGIAVLGTLAGSLASFFRLGEPDPTDEPESDVALGDQGLVGLTAEVAALRRQLEVLTAQLTAGRGNDAPGGG